MTRPRVPSFAYILLRIFNFFILTSTREPFIDVLDASTEAQGRAAALIVIQDEKALSSSSFRYSSIIFYWLFLNHVFIPGFDFCRPFYRPLFWSPVLAWQP
jgi:hypothetical protein